ncbi:MAG: hypothetical protein [Caudoviricetes sp.]|nr:MAG: hypothetical protein [Caudoviricetes sp.]
MKKFSEYVWLPTIALILSVIAIVAVLGGLLWTVTSPKGEDVKLARGWCSEYNGDYWAGMIYYGNVYAPSCKVPIMRGKFKIEERDYVFEKEILDYETGLIMVYAKRRGGMHFDGTYERTPIGPYITKHPEIEPLQFTN